MQNSNSSIALSSIRKGIRTRSTRALKCNIKKQILGKNVEQIKNHEVVLKEMYSDVRWLTAMGQIGGFT